MPKNTAFICMLLCISFAYPQETDLDLPVSVQESQAEVWVSGGLLQGQGHGVRQCRHGIFSRRLPLSSPDTLHTQLDEGPETPRATREASGVPFLRQDEA